MKKCKPDEFCAGYKGMAYILECKSEENYIKDKKECEPLTVPRLRPAMDMLVPPVCRIYSTNDAKFSGVTSHHFLKFLNFFHNMCNILSYLP